MFLRGCTYNDSIKERHKSTLTYFLKNIVKEALFQVKSWSVNCSVTVINRAVGVFILIMHTKEVAEQFLGIFWKCHPCKK